MSEITIVDMTPGAPMQLAVLQGPPGPSAFAAAQAQGYAGTLAQWLLSLKGEPGEPGVQGDPGPPGPAVDAYTRAQSDGRYVQQWAALAGETGVINPEYPPGDVRRYGVFPDGVTNWEGAHPARMTAIYANGCLPGVTIYWPGGLYKTAMNLSAAYSGWKAHSADAEFASVLHMINSNDGTGPALTNVTMTGRWITYDRFGAIKLQKSYIERVLCKSDPLKNLSGTKGRGVHIYSGLADLHIGEIVIEQCGIGAALNTDAAFSMDSSDCARVSIGTLWVQDCEGHGAYILGSNHDIGRLIVGGYGSGAHDRQLQESATLAQSQELCGLWLRRSPGTRIRECVIGQPAARANALYDLRVDDTANSTAGGPYTRPRIDRLTLTAVSKRGASIGDRNNNIAGLSELDIGTFEWQAMAATTLTAGYSALHVNANTGASPQAPNKLRVDHLIAHDVNNNPTLKVPANTFAHIGGIDSSRGVNGTVVDWQGSGYLGPCHHVHTGGSGTTTPFVITPAATQRGTKLGGILADANGLAPSITAVDLYAAAKVRGGPISALGYRGSPALRMNSAANCTIELGEITGHAAGIAGWGVRLSNATDVTLTGGAISAYSIGITTNGSGGAAGNTRVQAINLVSTGNTANTDVPAGGITAVAGCLNVTL